mgnify:CR=1 FL=1
MHERNHITFGRCQGRPSSIGNESRHTEHSTGTLPGLTQQNTCAMAESFGNRRQFFFQNFRESSIVASWRRWRYISISVSIADALISWNYPQTALLQMLCSRISLCITFIYYYYITFFFGWAETKRRLSRNKLMAAAYGYGGGFRH